LIITVASVDTGIVSYVTALFHDLFNTNFNPTNPNTILVCTVCLLLLQTIFNIFGVTFLGSISRIGTYVETLGTIGIAILLAAVGYHHGIGFLFTTQGAQFAHSNPLGVDFHGNWLLGAALVAVLAHVYIFYGFEAAGDVAEEVVDSSRRVPRAIISSLLIGGLTSFILVAGLLLAIPAGAKNYATATSFAGGVPFIISSNIHSKAMQDIILLLVCFAFFSCGLAVQGAGARLAFSYARDGALPGSKVVRKVSTRFRTPVNAVLLGAIVPCCSPSSSTSIRRSRSTSCSSRTRRASMRSSSWCRSASRGSTCPSSWWSLLRSSRGSEGGGRKDRSSSGSGPTRSSSWR
jgi:amino acid transporter